MRIAMYRKAGVKIGKVFTFGSNIFLDIFSPYNVVIGDSVILAGYDHVLTHSNILWGIKDEGGSVVIKNGARIGVGVTILPRVVIGENAVIGACSLVNKDIPDNCIAVGVPAKPIKLHHFYDNELYRKLTPSDMVRNVEIIKKE
jgi:acetyltransferase-like isoleucine patch superfamily enzyme